MKLNDIVAIIASDKQLRDIGINPLKFRNIYPNKVAKIVLITKANNKLCYGLHKGFTVTSEMIIHNDSMIYTGEDLKQILEDFSNVKEEDFLVRRHREIDSYLKIQTDRIKEETKIKLEKLKENRYDIYN